MVFYSILRAFASLRDLFRKEASRQGVKPLVSVGTGACIVFLLLGSLGTASAQTKPTEAEGRLSIGYYASYGSLSMELIPWKSLSHLCHAFLAIDNDGKLLVGESLPSSKLTEAAHKQGVKVLLSLGGGRTSTGLQRIAADEKKLATYVGQVVPLVAKHDYDGLHIDWEFPSDRQDRGSFVRLVVALHKSLAEQAKSSGRAEPYLLSTTVGPSGFFGKWIDIGAVESRLDWLQVMTYDMSGPWSRYAAHHAPLFPSDKDPERAWRAVSIAMDYWHTDRGVPKEKLVVGIPFYGRALPVVKPYAPLEPAKRKQHGQLAFSEIRELVGKGWPANWDASSQAPWLQTPDKKPLLIAYDDRNSVDKKAKWARDNGYRGLYYWALHHDRMSDGTHWLLRAATNAWPVAKHEGQTADE